jgi:LPPG:FO 2-phospho-L-lactate transferase
VRGERPTARRVTALCGGIGGAKLALGLYRVLGPGELTVIVNTGDDFEHLGLHVSPDLDTVLYTLAGIADAERGWGRTHESWNFMTALAELGGEDWFRLGDRDLALHVLRTEALRRGTTLSRFTADIAERLGIHARIVPMSDDAVRTVVDTDEGTLPFQRYFVERRCQPRVRGVSFEGARVARAADEAIAALAGAGLEAIVICPSNPYLSVDPILAVPGIREALEAAVAPVVAVSPIIGGAAVKGPTIEIMTALGVDRTSAAVAAHYRPFLRGLMIDVADAADVATLDVAVETAPTLMRDLNDREDLARRMLAFAGRVASAPARAARVSA